MDPATETVLREQVADLQKRLAEAQTNVELRRNQVETLGHWAHRGQLAEAKIADIAKLHIDESVEPKDEIKKLDALESSTFLARLRASIFLDDVQDAVCAGQCVHENDFCYRCGDVSESGCSPDYEVDREPRLVEA